MISSRTEFIGSLMAMDRVKNGVVLGGLPGIIEVMDATPLIIASLDCTVSTLQSTGCVEASEEP